MKDKIKKGRKEERKERIIITLTGLLWQYIAIYCPGALKAVHILEFLYHSISKKICFFGL
jgi:hypothetical protein